MRKLLLYGPGDLGKQAAYLIQTHFAKKFKVLGFVADHLAKETEVYKGLQVIGSFQEIINSGDFKPSKVDMLVTVGYLHMDERKRVIKAVVKAGYQMPNIISPFSVIEKNVEMGRGIIIDAGVIIDKNSKIGDCIFMNPGVCIAHDCEIGEGAIFGPRTVLGGFTKIGGYSFMGINCTIINNIKIGDFVFINAASLVTKDIPSFSKFREKRVQKILKRNDISRKQSWT